jgi:hypothetical protein
MPQTAETEVRKRGGAKAYRTVKSGDRTILVAIVPKAGPRGGHTVALAGPSNIRPAQPRKKVSRKKLRKAVKRRKVSAA